MIRSRKIMENFSWDTLARILMYTVAFLLPLWALPLTIAPVDINKAFLFYILTLFAFIAWLVGRIQEGEMRFPKNYIGAALLFLIIVAALSGLFSVSPHVSFLGIGSESGSVVAFLIFILAAFLMSFLFQEPSHARQFLVVIGISSLAVFFIQMAHIFTDFNFWNAFFVSKAANSIGTWNSFGIYWSFIGFLALFAVKHTDGVAKKLLFYALAFAAASSMIAVNFKIAWILFAVFNVILFAYFYSFKRNIKGMHWEPVLFLLIALFFIVTPVLGQTVSNIFGVPSIEVRPSWTTTWNVVRETLTGKNILLGSGPNTFVYDWLLHKPLEINATPFWGTRFSSGISFFATLLATLGILGAIAIAALIGTLFFYGFRAIVRFASYEEEGFFGFLSFLAVVYLLIVLTIYTPSFLIVAFFFLFLGLFMGQAYKIGIMSDYKIRIFQNAGMGFVSALLILFLSVISIGGAYLLGQRYAAAIYYGRGVKELRVNNDIDRARENFVRAIGLHTSDAYARSLLEIDVLRLQRLLTQTDVSIDELRAQFQTTLGQAIQTGQLATRINPVDPLNWFALGRIYEAVIPFNIEGAVDFADSMYARAHEQSPRSPEALFARARILVQKRSFEEGRKLLREANSIKSDYAPARFLLAQLEAQAGNLDEAINETRNAQFLVPNDIGVLFQLGILYYQAGQFDNAEQVFLRAIELNENYSNARYFLGLIYDRRGDKENAIGQFERIAELNPSNTEVKQILSNLRQAKPALTNIAPPAPEDRSSLPIEEGNKGE